MKKNAVLKENLKCVAEVKMTYRRNTEIEQQNIRLSRDVFDMARRIYDAGTIEYREQAWVLLLNTAGKVNGYFKAADGGIDSAVVDIRLVLQAALLTNSIAMVLIHNHPSGNSKPSGSDDTLTANLNKACQAMSMQLLDHVVITSEDYYSYADNGRL